MTSEVWYCIPTANDKQCEETLLVWKEHGYRTMAIIDGAERLIRNADKTLHLLRGYKGYANAVNEGCRHLLQHTDAQIIVTGGDDVLPDMETDAATIGRQFIKSFPHLFGVMQPTGDRFMEDAQGRCAVERVCGSPWMGRDLVRKLNQGHGPLWWEYFHFYVDEELHEVVKALGYLEHRRDLTQSHEHWTRYKRKRPAYLDRAARNNAEAKALFERRKAAGFPGSKPLEPFAIKGFPGVFTR